MNRPKLFESSMTVENGLPGFHKRDCIHLCIDEVHAKVGGRSLNLSRVC